jgi:hypothetical protein
MFIFKWISGVSPCSVGLNEINKKSMYIVETLGPKKKSSSYCFVYQSIALESVKSKINR